MLRSLYISCISPFLQLKATSTETAFVLFLYKITVQIHALNLAFYIFNFLKSSDLDAIIISILQVRALGQRRLGKLPTAILLVDIREEFKSSSFKSGAQTLNPSWLENIQSLWFSAFLIIPKRGAGEESSLGKPETNIMGARENQVICEVWYLILALGQATA